MFKSNHNELLMMVIIPDRISMDELSKLWILKALQELEAANKIETEEEQLPSDDEN